MANAAVDKHSGSSFDDFLEEEGYRDEVESVAIKRVLAWQFEQEMARQQKTKRAMAVELKTSRSQLDRLLDPQITAVSLDSTQQGRRDHTLLLFLYNTGARADEAAQVKGEDLFLAHSARDHSLVQIRGKGNKLRRCPLWSQTVLELSPFVRSRAETDHLFLNIRGQPITRFGIHTMVERYVQRLVNRIPSLARKRVSPHTIRHTTATHLLRAGVDINTIRAWLGHVSLNTTNIYAEVDLEMKAKALATCEIRGTVPVKNWKEDIFLMQFLQTL